MRVYEGSIVTCNADGKVARFLAEDKGKIAFVGDALPQEYVAAPREQLGEKALLPSFGDTHIHFLSYAFFSSGLDLRANATIADMQDAIAGFVRDRSPSFVVGFGASAHSVKEKRLLTREDIDSVCSDRAVFIAKYDGHAGIANSFLIAKVKAKLGGLRGFNGDSGLMTQEAFFRLTDFVTQGLSPPLLAPSLASTAREYGIGLVHSVTASDSPPTWM